MVEASHPRLASHTDRQGASPRAKVSVVAVNWNRVDDTLLCIKYLQRQPYDDLEIIIVDNGSTDGSVDELKKLPGITLKPLGANLGPARARNVGLELATGKYTLFIDSDAVISKKAIARMVHRMEADETIGILGCRIVNAFTRRIDQWIYHQPSARFHRSTFDTYSFSAAGAMVRTEAVRKIGGFWNELFMYNEEVDLSIRMIRAELKVIYDGSAYVFHRVSPKGRVKSGTYFYYQVRNWIWIFYRYYPAPARWKMIATYACVYLVKGLASLKLGSCLKGIMAGLRQRDIISRYSDKLTAQQVGQLAALNRRSSVKLGR
jgi:GT2 family glycosyltransferase